MARKLSKIVAVVMGMSLILLAGCAWETGAKTGISNGVSEAIKALIRAPIDSFVANNFE